MMEAPRAVSVIIPAHDEADYIDACLSGLWASDRIAGGAEAIVVANGCADDTARRATGHAEAAARAGWALRVLELPVGGKPGALTAGDAAASGKVRVYLDADVVVSAPLIAQIARILDDPAPLYASGRPVIARARSLVTRHYARFWQRLPFMSEGVPGFGLYAVNAAGRARWKDFPDIIADDTFVRLSFAPEERLSVSATFTWPVIEGFGPLVRVRHRQNAGVSEIKWKFPEHLTRDDRRRVELRDVVRLGLRDPVGLAVYSAVMVAVRAKRRSNHGWVRGR